MKLGYIYFHINCYVQQKHIQTELQVNASLLEELRRQQHGIRYNCEACASAWLHDSITTTNNNNEELVSNHNIFPPPTKLKYET